MSPAPHYAEKHGLPPAPADLREAYRAVLAAVFCSLAPGGTAVIGDHCEHGHPGVFELCKILEEVGFEHVDVAWRDRDYYVIAGAAPPEDPEPSWMHGIDSGVEEQATPRTWMRSLAS